MNLVQYVQIMAERTYTDFNLFVKSPENTASPAVAYEALHKVHRLNSRNIDFAQAYWTMGLTGAEAALLARNVAASKPTVIWVNGTLAQQNAEQIDNRHFPDVQLPIHHIMPHHLGAIPGFNETSFIDLWSSYMLGIPPEHAHAFQAQVDDLMKQMGVNLGIFNNYQLTPEQRKEHYKRFIELKLRWLSENGTPFNPIAATVAYLGCESSPGSYAERVLSYATGIPVLEVALDENHHGYDTLHRHNLFWRSMEKRAQQMRRHRAVPTVRGDGSELFILRTRPPKQDEVFDDKEW